MRVDQNVWKDDGLCPSTGKWQPQSSQVFERWLVVFGWSPNNLWWYQEVWFFVYILLMVFQMSRKRQKWQKTGFPPESEQHAAKLGVKSIFYISFVRRFAMSQKKKLIIVTYHCIGKEYIWLFWHSIWVAIPTKKKMTTQWENLSTGFCFCSSAALQPALAVKSTEWSGILWASTSNIHQLWIAWSDEPAFFISSTGLIIYDRGWNPMRPHPSLPRWLTTPNSVVQEHLWKPDIQVSAFCIYMVCEEYTVFSIAWS